MMPPRRTFIEHPLIFPDMRMKVVRNAFSQVFTRLFTWLISQVGIGNVNHIPVCIHDNELAQAAVHAVTKSSRNIRTEILAIPHVEYHIPEMRRAALDGGNDVIQQLLASRKSLACRSCALSLLGRPLWPLPNKLPNIIGPFVASSRVRTQL